MTIKEANPTENSVPKDEVDVDQDDSDEEGQVIERRKEAPRAAQVEVEEVASDSEMELDVGHSHKTANL